MKPGKSPKRNKNIYLIYTRYMKLKILIEKSESLLDVKIRLWKAENGRKNIEVIKFPNNEGKWEAHIFLKEWTCPVYLGD